MADWLLENNHLYLDIGDDGGWTAEPAQKYVRDTAESDAKPIRRRGRPRGSRSKSGAKSVVRKKSGATKGVEARDRNLDVLDRYSSDEIESALQEIRQRPKVGLSAERVFRARFLTGRPVTLSALGHELGLDRAGVTRKAQNTFNKVVDLMDAARRGKQHPVINSGIYR